MPPGAGSFSFDPGGRCRRVRSRRSGSASARAGSPGEPSGPDRRGAPWRRDVARPARDGARCPRDVGGVGSRRQAVPVPGGWSSPHGRPVPVHGRSPWLARAPGAFASEVALVCTSTRCLRVGGRSRLHGHPVPSRRRSPGPHGRPVPSRRRSLWFARAARAVASGVAFDCTGTWCLCVGVAFDCMGSAPAAVVVERRPGGGRSRLQEMASP